MRVKLLPSTLFLFIGALSGCRAEQTKVVVKPVPWTFPVEVKRADGRRHNSIMQKTVKGIAPAMVKEVCFVLEGEYPQPLPPITGPVSSQKEIAKILHAFSGSSRSPRSGPEPGGLMNHEEVWIALKDGRALVLDLQGFPDDYADSYGMEVARIMKKHHGSCTHEQVVAAGLGR